MVPQSVHKKEEGPLTKTEQNRFRAVLTATVAELEPFNRHRDAITVERSADQLEEIQAASQRSLAVCNIDREFNQLREARAALRRIQEGIFGPARRAMTRSPQSGLLRCRGLNSVYGARKP
jgi:hypothetical protein